MFFRFFHECKMTDNNISGENERSDEKTDPGSIRHGNFINYYQFHPAEERVRQLPRGVWQRLAYPARKYAGLDVGCNIGVRAAARRSCLSVCVELSQPKLGLRDLKLQTARLILVELSSFRYRSAQQQAIRFRNLTFFVVFSYRRFLHMFSLAFFLYSLFSTVIIRFT